ncbi:hypothetical protein MBLNU459_g1541t1 [Dothideomycetes sp. NU459]
MSAPAASPSLFGVIRACVRPAVRRGHLRSRLQVQQQPAFSSTRATSYEADVDRAERPRWQQTPRAMTMPVRTRRAPQQAPFLVNEDPAVLDEAYRKMLGQDGDQMLPEELKWLAVTHKSFDHARRGFNDRLAFLGKRIVDLQCSLALLNAPQMQARAGAAQSHTALKGLENVTSLAKHETLDKHRLAGLAQQYGLGKVIRWKPRKADNLQSSGQEVVLAHTIYSIIGALALQKGGEVANRTVRDRILSPLGLR